MKPGTLGPRAAPDAPGAQRWIAQGLAATAAVIGAISLVALLLPHQLSYVEGYMLEQAYRLANGGALYQDPARAPWIVDNFPPGWIAVLAVGVRWFGPDFTFGRLLSIASVGVLSWFVWWFARRRGDPSWLAMAAVGLWLLAPFVVRRMVLVRMDLPSLAFMAAGFAALLAWRGWRGVVAASLMFLAAVLCRQTALVAPAAAVLGLLWAGARGPLRGGRHWHRDEAGALPGKAVAWRKARALGEATAMGEVAAFGNASASGQAPGSAKATARGEAPAWTDARREAVGLAALFSGMLVAVVAVLQAATDGRFLLDVIVHNTGRWEGLRMWRHLGYLAAGHFLLIGLGIIGAWQQRHGGRGARLLAAWAVLQLATLWTVGKPGTAANHFLPALFLLAVHAGPGLQWLVARRPAWSLDVTAARAMAVQALVFGIALAPGILHTAAYQDDEARLVDRLSQTPGPVLSENAGAALQSGHTVWLEPRTTLEQHVAGRWDDDALVQAVEQQWFSLIVLETFPPYHNGAEGMRLTPDTWAAIQAHYEPGQRYGKWRVWTPSPA